ncbi:exosortase/archaeosortase family protein [Candidatus Poribacteria bacterium]|nr:exosortase/archaeosortase family protein [Candidatus Poribacteria bacterium]
MQERAHHISPLSRTPLALFLALALALLGAAYWSTFVWLWERAMAPDSYYSHALLIPFISAYLIWRRRERLREFQWESSLMGLVLILFALAAHLLSVLLDVYFTSGFSILALVFGLSLYLFGYRITRELLFPLGFLVFMFPLPGAALDAIGVPMKLFVTTSGAKIVELLGIPVIQEGFQLHFPSASLVIGNPCSGLRSLISLLALGSLYAYFLTVPLHVFISMLIVSIPIALFSNIVRVLTLSLIAHRYGSSAATGSVHDLSGFVVFVLALVLLLGIGRLFEWRLSKHGSR